MRRWDGEGETESETERSMLDIVSRSGVADTPKTQANTSRNAVITGIKMRIIVFIMSLDIFRRCFATYLYQTLLFSKLMILCYNVQVFFATYRKETYLLYFAC